MTTTLKRFVSIPYVVGLIVACAIGYGVAKLTLSPPAASLMPAVDSTAKGIHDLKVSADSMVTMGISLATVFPGDLRAEIQAPATVVAAPNGQALLTAHVAGTVTRQYKRLGDSVRVGETLALVESREASTIAAELATADSRFRLAHSVLDRERSLFDQKVTPRQDLDTAEMQYAAAATDRKRALAAKAVAGVTTDGRSVAIKSPMAGRITASNIILGAYVEAATELYRVADPRFVLIEATLPVLDARRVAPKDAVSVRTSGGPTLTGTVVSVTPTLDEQTRSAIVTVALAPGSVLPTPGELVQVRITTQMAPSQGFAVNDDAVQNVGGQSVVFVRSEDGFSPVPVTVGLRSGGRVEILSGITAGAVIADKNAFLLKAELGKSVEAEE